MRNYWKIISGYARTEGGNLNIIGKIFSIIIIFLLAFIVVKVVSHIIARRMQDHSIKKYNSYNRILTLVSLVEKLIKFLIYFIATTTSMEILGIQTKAIFATVGVGSLALSFGAQNLVKDVINGFFIIMEDQYAVGDLIEVSKEYEGVVEDLGLRCTKLRDFDGTLHIIPNGTVSVVSNKQRGLQRAKVDIEIDREEDSQKIKNIIEEALKVYTKDKRVGKGPTYLGITANTEKSYTISAVAFSELSDKYTLENDMRKSILDAVNKNNIKLPKTRLETENEV